MPDREEDNSDVEDLFGDLDEFFAPIDEVEWPEGEEPEAEDVPVPAEGEEEWAPEIEIPEEGQLLGAEAAAESDEEQEEEPDDVGELFGEEPEPAREAPVAEDAGEEESELFGPAEDETGLFSEPAAEPEIEPEPAAEPGAEAPPEATAEMSGEEWDRLRGELAIEAEDEAEDEASLVKEEPPADLSIDDLRAGAPPQYTDLPVSDEGEVLGDEPVLEEEEHLPPAIDEEAAPGEVEAAAAHFASGLDAEQVERELLADLGGETDGSDADEALGGAPTWQEPAAYEAEEPPPPPPPTGERNLTAAIASGAILAVAAITLLAIDKGPFVILAVGLVTLGQGELYAVLKQRGFHPATALGLIAGILTMAGAYLKGSTGQGESAMLFGVVIGAMLTVPWYMAAASHARAGAVRDAAATIFGIIYVPFMASFALLILATPGDVGRNVMLTVVGLTVLYDVCAYAIGTLWGNRPLAPTVSPRKSWEGAIGATFVLLLVALAIVPSIEPFTASNSIGLALVIALAAPLGDLVESAIKRDLGVKDMGSILPGHGGILDRLDAILFTAPAAYYYLNLIF